MNCVTGGCEQCLKSQKALMIGKIKSSSSKDEVENQWNTAYEKHMRAVAAVVQTLVCSWWLRGPREVSCSLCAAVTLQAHILLHSPALVPCSWLTGDLAQSLHCRSSLSLELVQVLSPCFLTGLLGLSERRSAVCSVMAAAGMAWPSSPSSVLLPPHLHVQ